MVHDRGSRWWRHRRIHRGSGFRLAMSASSDGWWRGFLLCLARGRGDWCRRMSRNDRLRDTFSSTRHTVRLICSIQTFRLGLLDELLDELFISLELLL